MSSGRIGLVTPAPLPAYSREQQRRARSGENFPISAWMLRPSRREARAAIYGFCRFVDDLGDEGLGDSEGQLVSCIGELDACYSGQPAHPIFQRLQPVIRRYQLERDPFRRLIEANLQDQGVSRYRTWEELDSYCRLSATPVGQLVLALEGIRDPVAVQLSDSICIGLQLANMWQDIASDRKRGRRYLPEEVLAAHGSGDAEWWSDASPTPAMVAAVADSVGRARRLLRDGWPLVERVPGLMRMEMATFILCGLAAADAALQAGSSVFERRAKLAHSVRRRAVARAALAWRAPRPPGA